METTVVFPAEISRLRGRADLHPAKVQPDRFNEYEPGLSDGATEPVTSHPLETQSTGSVKATPELDTTALIEL